MARTSLGDHFSPLEIKVAEVADEEEMFNKEGPAEEATAGKDEIGFDSSAKVEVRKLVAWVKRVGEVEMVLGEVMIVLGEVMKVLSDVTVVLGEVMCEATTELGEVMMVLGEVSVVLVAVTMVLLGEVTMDMPVELTMILGGTTSEVVGFV